MLILQGVNAKIVQTYLGEIHHISWMMQGSRNQRQSFSNPYRRKTVLLLIRCTQSNQNE